MLRVKVRWNTGEITMTENMKNFLITCLLVTGGLGWVIYVIQSWDNRRIAKLEESKLFDDIGDEDASGR
jgi:hypothetical protein